MTRVARNSSPSSVLRRTDRMAPRSRSVLAPAPGSLRSRSPGGRGRRPGRRGGGRGLLVGLFPCLEPPSLDPPPVPLRLIQRRDLLTSHQRVHSVGGNLVPLQPGRLLERGIDPE